MNGFVCDNPNLQNFRHTAYSSKFMHELWNCLHALDVWNAYFRTESVKHLLFVQENLYMVVSRW